MMTEHEKRKTKKIVSLSVRYFFLVLFSLFFLFPFFAMFFKSVMGELESLGSPAIVFFPTEWHWENYLTVLDKDFFTYAKNTLIVLAVTMIGVPLSSSLCAFAFARLNFIGKHLLFAIILSTIMLPSVVVQIPLYLLYRSLGMTENLLPLILPPLFGGGALNIFLVRQYMRSLPMSLDEAARIDGANLFQVYFRIVLPLCWPILVYVMVTVFNGVWNDFSGPLIYITNKDYYTLALGIYKKYPPSTTSSLTFPNYQMASGMLLVIPAAAVFLVFQKQLMEGVVVGGVKG